MKKIYSIIKWSSKVKHAYVIGLFLCLAQFLISTSSAAIPAQLSSTTIKSLIADPEFTDYSGLTLAISKESDLGFKSWAYRYIGEKNKVKAAEPFLSIYSSESFRARSSILSALRRFATTTSEKPYSKKHGRRFELVLSTNVQTQIANLFKEEFMSSQWGGVRYDAFYGLCTLKRPEMIEIIAAATTDKSVGKMALQMLDNQRGPKFRAFWLKQIKVGSPQIKLIAINALGVDRDIPKIEDALKAISKDDDPDLRKAALQQLEWRKKRREQSNMLYSRPFEMSLIILRKM
jgi:hypothetical protein